MADEGSVRRGPAADLSILRATGKDPASQQVALTQLLDESKEERVLLECLPTLATITVAPNAVEYNDDDKEEEENNEENDDHKQTEGITVITSERLIFWATDEVNGDNDLLVDAVCIDLHAISQDPLSVYLQIQSPKAAATLELFLFPTNEESRALECQSLYDTLTQLISLHPIDPNADEEGHPDDDDDDIMFVAAPPPCTTACEADSSIEEVAEREAMLQRLDQMLVVPPDLERHSDDDDDDDDDEHAESDNGRFDDAMDDPFL